MFASLAAGDEYFDCRSGQGDYLFSAGRYGRDFPTLLAALEGSHTPVIIVSDAENRASLSLQLAANQRVTYMEEIAYKEFSRLMAQARLVVIPLAATAYHTGQTVLVQAMAMGKAVVVAKGPGTIDYVEDGVDALLYEPGNSAQLRSILDLLQNNPAEALRLGKAARARALRDFTEASFVQTLIKEIEHGTQQKS